MALTVNLPTSARPLTLLLKLLLIFPFFLHIHLIFWLSVASSLLYHIKYAFCTHLLILLSTTPFHSTFFFFLFLLFFMLQSSCIWLLLTTNYTYKSIINKLSLTIKPIKNCLLLITAALSNIIKHYRSPLGQIVEAVLKTPRLSSNKQTIHIV